MYKDVYVSLDHLEILPDCLPLPSCSVNIYYDHVLDFQIRIFSEGGTAAVLLSNYVK